MIVGDVGNIRDNVDNRPDVRLYIQHFQYQGKGDWCRGAPKKPMPPAIRVSVLCYVHSAVILLLISLIQPISNNEHDVRCLARAGFLWQTPG